MPPPSPASPKTRRCTPSWPPDGSVTSTTVSAHLYNAAGLSGVTDRSTLTDIVNTESDAAFTQNGDSLTWDTTDTDVYYKGNTSRALPVSAAVTYTLDGETARWKTCWARAAT